MEIIRSFGYIAEEFQDIKTEDGYLLTVHRIPYGKSNKNPVNRPVVFLMHGLLSSAVDFVNMGPGVSIAYDLAEAGYDVWMGNARGTKMSRHHEFLSATLNSKKYWDFRLVPRQNCQRGSHTIDAHINFSITPIGSI